jgi:nitroreductase
VVQDVELAQKIVPQTAEGNVVIVISTEGNANKEITDREIIDCALATQSIYLAAQALGYGSRIYTGPIANINNNLKGELGFPAGREAVAAVWVGKVSADAVSAASPRKAADETVTFK